MNGRVCLRKDGTEDAKFNANELRLSITPVLYFGRESTKPQNFSSYSLASIIQVNGHKKSFLSQFHFSAGNLQI
jgi:hypothetical protein